MDAIYRKLIILILAACLSGCAYDLDVGGFFYTSADVEERFHDSQRWITEHQSPEIIADSPVYSFLVGGDSHIGGKENTEKMLQNAVSSNVAAVFIAGDVTTGRKEHMERADSLFKAFPTLPSFMIPGNHDLYFKGWETFHSFFGPSVFALTIRSGSDKDLAVCLDSGSGTLGETQLQWLVELLERERSSCRYVVILTHLNFFRNRFTGSTNPLNEEVVALLDIFTRYSVDLFIQGHDHRRYETSFGKTACVTMDALKDGSNNASYLAVTIDAEGISYDFKDL